MAEPGAPIARYLLGAVAGFVLTVVVGSVILAFGGYAYVRSTEAEVRRGWNLVPVVVAAFDLPAGTRVTVEQLSRRSVPEQLVTSSVVRPDSASYVVNQVLSSPVSAGEPLRWSALVSSKRPFWQCTEAETAACSKDTPALRATTNDELRERLGARR